MAKTLVRFEVRRGRTSDHYFHRLRDYLARIEHGAFRLRAQGIDHDTYLLGYAATLANALQDISASLAPAETLNVVLSYGIPNAGHALHCLGALDPVLRPGGIYMPFYPFNVPGWRVVYESPVELRLERMAS